MQNNTYVFAGHTAQWLTGAILWRLLLLIQFVWLHETQAKRSRSCSCAPVVCCYQCFMFSLSFVLTRLVFFPVFLWWFLLGQQQYIFVKTFVQFPSLSRIVYSTLFLSGSVFTCVVHVYVLCGVITACVVCLVNHCGTSHIKCMYFWASCLVVGGHGGQTICASGYQVRLLDNTDT